MVMPNSGATAVPREMQTDKEVSHDGRTIMRMPEGRGKQVRKPKEPAQVINEIWASANDKMRDDWLKIYCAILPSSGEASPRDVAIMADECYFEFYARANPSKYDPQG